MSARRDAEAGFSLIEIVVAIGVAVVVSACAFATLRASVAQALTAASSAADARALDELAAALRRDAATATAVWIPPGTTGEVDFTSSSGNGPARWRYRFDGTLHRESLDGTQLAPLPAMQTLLSFATRAISVSSLDDPSNANAPAFAGLPTAAPVAFSDAGGGITGNGIVEVTFAGAHAARTVHVSSQSAPTGFGVERGAKWHAVVWREPHTQRSLFGFAQRTHYNIYGEIVYSFDDWKTQSRWCSYEIYSKLDVGDGRADFTYHDESESASTIFAECRRRNGGAGLPPPPGGTVEERAIE